jgi:hypothetical protein
MLRCRQHNILMETWIMALSVMNTHTGISNRLTGGPSNVFCLQNAEEMGEGWSDYIALMHHRLDKARKNDGASARGAWYICS